MLLFLQDSNYVTKIRRIVGSALFLQGKLDDGQIKRLGFLENPPAAMPLKEEYNKPKAVPAMPTDLQKESMKEYQGAGRIRKYKNGWKTPRFF